MSTQHIQAGKWAEKLAAVYLEKQGWLIIDRNFRSRYGELDIIAAQGKQLIIVEVRYRKSVRYGRPEETVNRRKQAKVVSAAEYYLQTHKKYNELPVRFDVIAICGELTKPELTWIKNAFDASF